MHKLIHSTLSCQYSTVNMLSVLEIHYCYSDIDRCKIPDCRKTFNNVTGSPMARGHQKGYMV
ncbi:MAG: hypothetical protein ACTS73_08315 [Arsenophonus sp. NEOnobi-MAG3]